MIKSSRIKTIFEDAANPSYSKWTTEIEIYSDHDGEENVEVVIGKLAINSKLIAKQKNMPKSLQVKSI